PFFQGKAEFGEIYPKPVKYCTKPYKIAHKGEILISVRAPVGDVNIAPFKCAIGRGLASIKPLDIEKLFLFYLLIFSKERIENEGTGSTFKAIKKHNLLSFKVPLPPLEEQKQIAHILSTIDKKIEVEQKRKEILKELFKTMLHKLMSGEIRLKDVEI
ncbi:restriction endonuclease subunit S, partial [Caldisericum sp.]|uniref:restriction endonuclease subunit S n=1 Tax=Caldisericum sp. TaxID=2499687 RepID=UPI003D0D8C7E